MVVDPDDLGVAYAWFTDDFCLRIRRWTLYLFPILSRTTSAASKLHSTEIRILLFQLVRELLFNVVKHAGVKHARVEIKTADAQLVIQIVDEGKGFDVTHVLSVPQVEEYGLRRIR
jgi:signal transduction histidine kinase